jgi:hypothetical protein
MDKHTQNPVRRDARHTPRHRVQHLFNNFVFNSNRKAFKIKVMGWFKANFRQALILAVIVAMMSLGSSILFKGWVSKEDKLKSAASIDYVDKQNCKQDEVIQEHHVLIDNLEKSKVDKVDLQATNLKIDKIYEWIMNNPVQK